MVGFKETIELLKKEGYIESRNKPDLFYKKMDKGVYFADLRGTEIVEIDNKHTEPLFYANIDGTAEEQRSFWSNEYNQLLDKKIDVRLSFKFNTNPPFDDVCTEVHEDGKLSYF